MRGYADPAALRGAFRRPGPSGREHRAALALDVNGYVDGYASCRTGTDPVYVAVAANNDGSPRDDAAGTDWADNVVDPVAAHAAGYAGVMVAGANDIEPDFTGTESEAEAWTNAFLAATSAPYIFIGAASGCPTTGVGGDCNWSRTQQNFYNLAHGLSPSRILALPQIYYPENGAQWRYISQSGASGADRISFLGALSEYAACRTAGSGCPAGYLTAAASWALRDALSVNAAVSVRRLPVSTDLRIDSVPGASTTAKAGDHRRSPLARLSTVDSPAVDQRPGAKQERGDPKVASFFDRHAAVGSCDRTSIVCTTRSVLTSCAVRSASATATSASASAKTSQPSSAPENTLEDTIVHTPTAAVTP